MQSESVHALFVVRDCIEHRAEDLHSVHPVGKIVVAVGLDDEIGDFSSLGTFSRV